MVRVVVGAKYLVEILGEVGGVILFLLRGGVDGSGGLLKHVDSDYWTIAHLEYSSKRSLPSQQIFWRQSCIHPCAHAPMATSSVVTRHPLLSSDMDVLSVVQGLHCLGVSQRG